MEKPVDILVEELKKEGLEVAEETAKAAVKAVFRSLPKFVAATENKYDDMLLPVLAIIEPKVLEMLDEINKEDNE
jgi:hypothetical protein